MANRSRLTTFLLILRFVPIITQLVDDVVTEFKSKDTADKADPLHASKMRAAMFKDENVLNKNIVPNISPEQSISDREAALAGLAQLRSQVDKSPGLAFDTSLQRLLNDADEQIRLGSDVPEP